MATSDDGNSSPQSHSVQSISSGVESQDEEEATPLSSPPFDNLSLSSKAVGNPVPPLEPAAKNPPSEVPLNAEDDEEDDIWVSKTRRRGKAALLVDSDDE